MLDKAFFFFFFLASSHSWTKLTTKLSFWIQLCPNISSAEETES